MTPTLLHTGEAPATELKPIPILVIGPAAHALANALMRMKSNTEIHSADNAQEAIELLKTKAFDHVLIDNRNDGALSLTIPALSRVETIDKLTVLAGPQSYDAISVIPGVGSVIKAPYNPVEIANSLNIDIVDSRKAANSEYNESRRKGDAAPEAEAGNTIENEQIHEEVVIGISAEQEEDEQRPIANRILSALVNFIPSLTPIISMLYKNAALTILAALFVAFVSYGVMIAYFLTSGDWSTPLQLQRGHELVIKAERERGELQSKASRGKSSLSRAETLEQITRATITQEIKNRQTRLESIAGEVAALQDVITSYGSVEDRKRDKQELLRDYKARIITRKIYQQSLISITDIERTLLSLKQQITQKKSERIALEQGVIYLSQLKKQLDAGEESINVLSGNAAFVPLANQIIEVQQARSSGQTDLNKFEATKKTLQDSLSVLENSIKEIEATPMIRALKAPVNVLFVPYDNLDAYEQGEHLYTCAIAIIWCSNVGTVGAPIGGEITTTHPFFGKPLRGQFVEAHLTEKSAAKKEIIHVGRPPLLF